VGSACHTYLLYGRKSLAFAMDGLQCLHVHCHNTYRGINIPYYIERLHQTYAFLWLHYGQGRFVLPCHLCITFYFPSAVLLTLISM